MSHHHPSQSTQTMQSLLLLHAQSERPLGRQAAYSPPGCPRCSGLTDVLPWELILESIKIHMRCPGPCRTTTLHNRTFSPTVLPRPQGIPSTASRQCPPRGPHQHEPFSLMQCHMPGPLLPLVFHYLASSQKHFQVEQKGLPCFLKPTLPAPGCSTPRPLGHPPTAPSFPCLPCHEHLSSTQPIPARLVSVARRSSSCDSSPPGELSGSGRAQGQVWDSRLAQTAGSGCFRRHLSIPCRTNMYVVCARAWAPCPGGALTLRGC